MIAPVDQKVLRVKALNRLRQRKRHQIKLLMTTISTDGLNMLCGGLSLRFLDTGYYGHYQCTRRNLFSVKRYAYNSLPCSHFSYTPSLLRHTDMFLIAILTVIHCMDCRVSDLALVDSHHGRFLPDLEWSWSDSRGCTKHLEVPKVSVMIHQHFPSRLVYNRLMILDVMDVEHCSKSSRAQKQQIAGNVFESFNPHNNKIVYS